MGELIVLPLDCQQAVEVFLAVDTQWRCVLAGSRLVRLGLDYAGVRAGLSMMCVRPSAELFVDLKLMEDEALVVLSGSAGS